MSNQKEKHGFPKNELWNALNAKKKVFPLSCDF